MKSVRLSKDDGTCRNLLSLQPSTPLKIDTTDSSFLVFLPVCVLTCGHACVCVCVCVCDVLCDCIVWHMTVMCYESVCWVPLFLSVCLSVCLLFWKIKIHIIIDRFSFLMIWNVNWEICFMIRVHLCTMDTELKKVSMLKIQSCQWFRLVSRE